MKKRIITWIIFLVISVGYIVYSTGMVEEIVPNQVKVYNDVASESAVKAIFNSSVSATKAIGFVKESGDANVIITKTINELNKDIDIISSSYTPLIVCMKNSSNLQKYLENGLLISSNDEIKNSVEDEITIDFKKIIDAVINGDNWSLFGGEDREIRIIIPEDDTFEGKIFYKFLVTTINGGTYPADEDKLDSAQETADKFLDAENCIETEDVIKDMTKISTINDTDIYVLFEADLMNSSIWSQKKLDIAVAYPDVTLVRHLYIQKISEDDLNSFLNLIPEELNYRNSNTSFADIEEKNYNVNDNFSFIEVNEDEDMSLLECIMLSILIILFIVMIVIMILYLAS